MWANTSASNPASPTTPQIPSASSPTYRLRYQGRRVAQIVKLKPECVEEYKKCHAKVWPEVLQQIKNSNIEDCKSKVGCYVDVPGSTEVYTSLTTNICLPSLSLDSIFHDPGTGILFASFKYVGYDWAGDMERMRENPKVQEWWKMTDSFQESFVEGATSSYGSDGTGEPSWWRGIQEVFYTP
jgi:L-rhamnose mutarotase